MGCYGAHSAPDVYLYVLKECAGHARQRALGLRRANGRCAAEPRVGNRHRVASGLQIWG